MTEDDDTAGPKGAARAKDVREFVERLTNDRHHLHDLDDGSHEELQVHIAAVKSQLDSEAPEHGLVDEALDAVHRLLSSSTTQKAGELLREAGRFLTGVG